MNAKDLKKAATCHDPKKCKSNIAKLPKNLLKKMIKAKKADEHKKKVVKRIKKRAARVIRRKKRVIRRKKRAAKKVKAKAAAKKRVIAIKMKATGCCSCKGIGCQA